VKTVFQENSMSHIVTIQTQIRDLAAIWAACRRLELAEPVEGTVKLFSGEVAGWAVQLPQWTYPIVCDVSAGKVHYDNFQGRWGDQKELDRFVQAYAVEKVRIEARRAGRSLAEQTLSDGSIKLTIQVAGGAA
jgi:hypothetical protein